MDTLPENQLPEKLAPLAPYVTEISFAVVSTEIRSLKLCIPDSAYLELDFETVKSLFKSYRVDQYHNYTTYSFSN